MKGLEFVAILAGVGLIYYVLGRSREPFVAEFLEQGNVRRTAETATSSYAQQTNHFQMSQSVPEKPNGVETPFRVNAFNSFQPI
jgi:hypothetical protein